MQYWLIGFLPTKVIFTRIYKRHIWGNRETVSGAGSTIESTSNVRRELPILLKELGAKSLLDIPCGDFHWFQEINFELEKYIGADIVGELIELNARRYAGKRISFICLDITKDALPSADVLLCRDCLVHLSTRNILRVVRNIKSTSARYLITTTFPDVKENIDVPTGSFRPINLQLPPFNFPMPMRLLYEYTIEGEPSLRKCLGVWRVEYLRGKV
ncbi:MAG: class I SAM-dependent methyltransferase [Bacteroidetes bacterium]|nr:MAG: class I SAM-dependent methyltransferase [Bacteroidota bacterium]